MDAAPNHPQHGTLTPGCHDQTPLPHHSSEPAAEHHQLQQHPPDDRHPNSSSEAPGNCPTGNIAGPVLKSRSPFKNSLSERDVKKAWPVNPPPPQSLPPQFNSSDRYPPPAVSALRPSQQGRPAHCEDSILSRGAYSLQPGSHDSSGTSGSSMSSVRSYEWTNSSSLPPANPSWNPVPGYHTNPGSMYQPRLSAGDSRVGDGSRYPSSGQLPSHAGPITAPGVQGQGYYRPQPQYYPHYGSASATYNSGTNWNPNEGAHPVHQYQMQAPSQQVAPTQPPLSYAPHATPVTHGQSPYVPTANQQTRGENAAVRSYPDGYYAPPSHGLSGYTTSTYSPQYGSSAAYTPASYRPPHPSSSSSFSTGSFPSSVATNSSYVYDGSNYSYEYGYTPANVPYAPLPSHGSALSNGSLPHPQSNPSQNGYAPSSIPYYPLSTHTSGISSPPHSSTPPSGSGQHSNPAPRTQGAPSGQPLRSNHLTMHEQRHQQPSHVPTAHVPTGRSRTPSPPLEKEIEYSEPFSFASTTASGDVYRSAVGGEESLVKSLDTMHLKSKPQSEISSSANPGQYQARVNAHISQTSHRASNHKKVDDDDDVKMPLLSGLLSSQHFDDKTHFLSSSSIEIVEQPKDCEVALNGRAEFTCKARLLDSAGEEELDYLWYKDGEPLIGEISRECVVEAVGEAEQGSYFCLVSHPSEESSVETQPARLTLKTGNDSRAPMLTQQPEAYIEAVKEEPLILSIKAKGEPPISYKWFKGMQELQHCTGNTLRVASASALDNGQYCCTVSNAYGSVLSDIVQVKVVLQRTVLPPITQLSPSRRGHSSNHDEDAPSDQLLQQLARPVARQTGNWGRLALFLGLLPTDAANSQHYQASREEQAYHLLREWRKRKHGTVYALRTILTQAGIDLDSHPSVTSVTATSPAALSISSQPRNVVVVYGQEARLEVKTEATDRSTKYQWYKNGRLLSGKTDKQLVIASTVDSDQGSYHCQISTSGGSIVSHSATIEVVSVARRQRAFESIPLAKEHSEEFGRAQYSSGRFGLTGRGVEDDNIEPRPQPLLIRAKSVPSITTRGSERLQITEHPQSQEVSAGSPITLTCGATGCDEVNYMWYMNGLSLPEDTRPDYHIASMTEEEEGMYSCEVSSTAQTLMSRMASLSLKK